MRSLMMRLAVWFVRAWSQVYTWGMPAAVREARIAEIQSDLWESQCDADGGDSVGFSLHLILRVLLGIPDDLGWRVECAAGDGTLAPRTLEIAGRTAGAAVFMCLLFLVIDDAKRERAAGAVFRSAPASDAEIHVPAGGMMTAGKRVPLLSAGIAATLGVLILPVEAQSPPPAMPTSNAPAFEVASVRKNVASDARTMLAPQPGGRLTATNVTAAMLIRFAYDLPDFQISGGPGWLDSDRFDVHAKAEGDPPIHETRLMLRRLLADRFKLAVHSEVRELPVYALVTSRRDGRLGPQLRRSETDCSRADPQTQEGGIAIGAKAGASCGFFGFSPTSEFASGRAGLSFRGLDMVGLAKRLMPILRRSVVDRTALTGYYDGDFDMIAELPMPPPPPGASNPFDAPFASIFAVLPQQLGLKLDSARAPVNVLVIDGVERPAAE